MQRIRTSHVTIRHGCRASARREYCIAEHNLENYNMPETFGARLRHHRERRRISLETIAEQTKIKASLLDGLERGDVSQWPSGIFRRAYVRAYAQAIGADPDATVREFLELNPDTSEVLPIPPSGHATRLRSLFDSAFGSLSRRRAPNGTDAPAESGPQPQAGPPAPDPKPVPTDSVRPTPTPTGAVMTRPVVASSLGVGTVPAAPAPSKPDAQPDLLATARLCTDLGRVKSVGELLPILRDAMKLLGARGLIVWTWDAGARELRPTIIHGYSDKVRARLRPVTPDADNATAAAFRSGETCAVAGRDNGRSALAVPLLSAAGCAGVLAMELPNGREHAAPIRATATCVAAMLAQLVAGPSAQSETRDDSDVEGGRSLSAGA